MKTVNGLSHVNGYMTEHRGTGVGLSIQLRNWDFTDMNQPVSRKFLH